MPDSDLNEYLEAKATISFALVEMLLKLLIVKGIFTVDEVRDILLRFSFTAEDKSKEQESSIHRTAVLKHINNILTEVLDNLGSS